MAKRAKKSSEAGKTEYIEMRCDAAEKEAFKAAADALGLSLSQWIRSTLRKAAKRELEAVDKPVAFIR
jgi:uncharacterized protein (DUF1778 family)